MILEDGILGVGGGEEACPSGPAVDYATFSHPHWGHPIHMNSTDGQTASEADNADGRSLLMLKVQSTV